MTMNVLTHGADLAQWPLHFAYRCSDCGCLFRPTETGDYDLQPAIPGDDWNEGMPERVEVTCPDCSRVLIFWHPGVPTVASAARQLIDDPESIPVTMG